MDSENVNLENVSAFMVHHVLKKRNGSKVGKPKRLPLKQSKFKKLQLMQAVKKKQKNVKRKHQESSQSKYKISNPKVPMEINDKTSPLTNGHDTIPEKLSFDIHFENKSLFQWMISPKSVEEFMKSYWENEPLYLSNNRSDFSVLLSTPQIDDLLTNNNIQYTKNIDITFYSNGVKEVHNLEGRARPHVVWDFYCNHCSIRLLNPQTFVPNIHKLTSELQEYFGCFVGCNAYLTPPNSQGFAPHSDDIEAFIIQIEGKKRWKVYNPRTVNETLPRYSSGNFTNAEIGAPILEVLLTAGDVLYIPRGFIHQATTEGDNHSLHITVSAYQRNAWIDLLEKAIPSALERAWKRDLEFRKGLPLDYLNAAGLGCSKNNKTARAKLQTTIKSLIYEMAEHVNLDAAVDQLGIKFMYDALPPVLTEEERRCSVYGGGLKMIENGQIRGMTEFEMTEDTEIALLRRYVSRFVKEKVETEGAKKKKKIEYRLYYTTDNSLEYHGEVPSFLIIPKNFVECIQFLFQSFPDFITVSQLPHPFNEDKMNLISDLWERGIIRTKEPALKCLKI